MFSGKPSAKKLLVGAQKGDCKLIKRCLKAGFKTTERDTDGKPLLHLAVRGDHSKAVSLLLSEGADVMATDQSMRTALHLACEMGLPETADLLIDAICAKDAAALDAVTADNETALHFAVKSGSRSICRQLVHHGADVSVRNSEHKTALEYAPKDLQALVMRAIEDRSDQAESEYAAICTAAITGDEQALTKELSIGRPVDACNSVEQSVLQLAAGSRQPGLVKLLIASKADVNHRDCFGRTALHLCAVEGAEEPLALLLTAGAKSLPDGKGSLPLHRAVEWGRTSIAELLLKHNPCDLSVRDGSGRSPLQLAANYGKLKTATALLALGANVTDADPQGMTPLHEACRSSRVKVAKLLLDHNADATATALDGSQALHHAVVTRRPGLVEMLLSHGANTLQANQAGDTPLHTLLRWERPQPVPVARGVDKVHKVSEVAMHEKACALHLQTMQLLCSHVTMKDPPPWPVLDCVGANGETPLHIAVRQKHKDAAISLLSQFFVSTEIVDSSGATALSVLDSNSYPADVAQAIRNAATTRVVPKPRKPLPEELEDTINEGTGADVEVLLQERDESLDDSTGVALIHLAASLGKADCVGALLSAEVGKVNCKDANGSTLLHTAAKAGSRPVVELLLNLGAMADTLDSEGKYPADVCPPSLEDMLADALSNHATKHLFDALNEKLEDVALQCIDAGASLTEVDEYGCNPLMVACILHMVNVVEVILSKRPEMVDSVDETCQTPLHWAAGDGCLPAVKLLLEHDATIDSESELQQTALHRAVQKGHSEVVLELVRQGARVDLTDFSGNTPLSQASPELRAAMEELLPTSEQTPESLSELSPEQATARLFSCLGEGAIDMVMVSQLLENHPDMDAVDEYGASLLTVAAIAGYKGVVEAMLNSSADISATDPNFQTALHWAAIEGHGDVCQLLVARGAEIDAPDVMKQTPLHWAVKKGKTTVIDVLLAAGADPLLADSRGVSSLDTATCPVKERLQLAVDLLAAAQDMKTGDETSESRGDDIDELSDVDPDGVAESSTAVDEAVQGTRIVDEPCVGIEDMSTEQADDGLPLDETAEAIVSAERESAEEATVEGSDLDGKQDEFSQSSTQIDVSDVTLPEVPSTPQEQAQETAIQEDVEVVHVDDHGLFEGVQREEQQIQPTDQIVPENENKSEANGGEEEKENPTNRTCDTVDEEICIPCDDEEVSSVTDYALECQPDGPSVDFSSQAEDTSLLDDCDIRLEESDTEEPAGALPVPQTIDQVLDNDGPSTETTDLEEAQSIRGLIQHDSSPTADIQKKEQLLHDDYGGEIGDGTDLETVTPKEEVLFAPDPLTRSEQNSTLEREEEKDVVGRKDVRATEDVNDDTRFEEDQCTHRFESTVEEPQETGSESILEASDAYEDANGASDSSYAEEVSPPDDEHDYDYPEEGLQKGAGFVGEYDSCQDEEEHLECTPHTPWTAEDGSELDASGDVVLGEADEESATSERADKTTEADSSIAAKALVDRMFAGVEQRAERLIDEAVSSLLVDSVENFDGEGGPEEVAEASCQDGLGNGRLPPPPPPLTSTDVPPAVLVPPAIDASRESTTVMPLRNRRQLDEAMRISLALLPPALTLVRECFPIPSEPAPLPPPLDGPSPPPSEG